MLRLQNIKREYESGSYKVEALKGISISFRQNEFVSVLGPSGCGKTTLLNLIGGLDSASEGDILINGKSTKLFTSRDWDAYRNHAVGFVFQSYNLIPHQSVLANVELALTLAGTGAKERRERALNVLKKVGLAGEEHKKPSQLSGGQMQRVAIARALINDPQILLADEPTGALDSETGEQVMRLLNEIARDRLVIMVTHNPALAKEYSTRIIRLLDGQIVDDTNPVSEHEQETGLLDTTRTSMSFLTALKLSFNNLFTKKTRTLLISFAGSIGIIGIALILALSNGVREYIYRIEHETLASYPVTLTKGSMDVTSIASGIAPISSDLSAPKNSVTSTDTMRNILLSVFSGTKPNDLRFFKAHIESDPEFQKLGCTVSYSYNTSLQVWSLAGETPLRVNPSSLIDDMIAMGETDERTVFLSLAAKTGDTLDSVKSFAYDVFRELPADPDIRNSEYELLAGRMPEDIDEIVFIVSKLNTISDYDMYTLGLRPRKEIHELVISIITDEPEPVHEKPVYTYDELMQTEYKLLIPTDLYVPNGASWRYIASGSEEFLSVLENSMTLKVVGIVCPGDDTPINSSFSSIGYMTGLQDYMINAVNTSPVVQAQMADPNYDVLRGMRFEVQEFNLNDVDLGEYENIARMVQGLVGEDKVNEIIRSVVPTYGSGSSYENNLEKFGVCDPDDPDTISIYAHDFESKKKLEAYIEAYNEQFASAGKRITYTDYVSLLMNGITDIVNAITYVLIAFVAVSLIVSSIMIGVITYISVLERTKEIGILRAIGASRRDISRVFNAETLVIGCAAGLIGVALSALMIIPINRIIYSIAGVEGLAVLPLNGAALLIIISMLLTLTAGLLPSRFAARRDPVVALRNE
ncbi:MAG: ABC transporter ATP-binding protein/permease [Clostridia bacterium]|nr:ABC transporter ATP-binding protein/permease [Clostridia bacterium]